VNSNGTEQSTVKAELLKLVRDHVWFASANPQRIAEIAQDMGIPSNSVFAYMITEHICEEFHFKP